MSILIDDSTVSEFKKDRKKLCKKYRYLEEDLERVKKILRNTPANMNLVVRIENLGSDVRTPIYKLKKFRSLDMRGRGQEAALD